MRTGSNPHHGLLAATPYEEVAKAIVDKARKDNVDVSGVEHVALSLTDFEDRSQKLHGHKCINMTSASACKVLRRRTMRSDFF